MLTDSVPAALKDFEILQRIASEGQGEVFLARSAGKKLVAVKVLHDRGALSESAAAALGREGTLAARLNHESIVQPKRLIVEGDFAALVLEFVPGVSLLRLLRFAAGRGVRLPEQAAWYIFERLLAALGSAHGKKADAQAPAIVHGDVSPANVLLGWDGTVKLADFGMARMRGLLNAGPAAAGTPGCMSPEQARGEPVTDRSDVFSAALVAWRMATGRTPYARERGDDAALLEAAKEVRLAPLGKIRDDLPVNITDAISQALAADPAARDLGAEELRQLVRGAFDLDRGKAELVTLLKRWREPLEKTITPWARQASLHDDEGAPGSAPKPKADAAERHEDLALTLPDDAPSSPPLVSTNTPSEGALIATTGAQSMSRLGSSVPDALEVDPLPAMRITMPSIPVYGGPAVNLPVPVAKQPFFSGKVAAFFVLSMIIMLVALAVLMFRLLSPPSHPVGEAPSLLISERPV